MQFIEKSIILIYKEQKVALIQIKIRVGCSMKLRRILAMAAIFMVLSVSSVFAIQAQCDGKPFIKIENANGAIMSVAPKVSYSELNGQKTIEFLASIEVEKDNRFIYSHIVAIPEEMKFRFIEVTTIDTKSKKAIAQQKNLDWVVYAKDTSVDKCLSYINKHPDQFQKIESK